MKKQNALPSKGLGRWARIRKSIFRAPVLLTLLCATICTGLLTSTLLRADDKITDITISISQESYQTWVDETALTNPPELIVTLSVTVSESYTTGGTIELPLSFTPTLSTHPSFTSGIDGVGTLEPFFDFKTAALTAWIASTSNTLIDSYSISGGVLTLTIKNSTDSGFLAGKVNIPLRFDFNMNWVGKIPGGTELWAVAPIGKIDSSTIVTPAAKHVTSGADNAITNNLSRLNPNTTTYYGGGITLRNQLRYQYQYRVGMDPVYINTAYIEVPTGSTVGSVVTNYYKDGIIVGNGTNGVDIGYTRYFRILNPSPSDTSHADWNYWKYQGVAWSTFQQTDCLVTPPTAITDGTTIYIRFGSDYKHINGEVKTNFNQAAYTKVLQPVWALVYTGYHSTGGTTVPVCDLGGVGASVSVRSIGYSSYVNSSTKNTGSGPITGVRFELYQNTAGSAKVNFDSVTLTALRDETLPAWSSYRLAYEIIDTHGTAITSDDSTRTYSDPTVRQPTATGTVQNWTLTLPTLSPTEYINKIIVIPMGTDGLPASEGLWPSMNGISLQYTARAWAGGVWPDGTAMPAYTAVSLSNRMYYNTEASTPTSANGNAYNIYYTSAPYAMASMTSASATGRLPGDLVDYTIIGYNNGLFTSSSAGIWYNPKVMIRVPVFMEVNGLEGASPGATTMLTGTDLASSSTFAVQVTLENRDSQYNYYSFQAYSYNARRDVGYNPVFTIPVQFKLSNTAKPGTYP
ncbi:MAG: hypothetical protein FWC25_00780, partial [Dehalococcoidia bacterium]|nr:hypothetical protein [Dehalococcoidia bacterium]